MDDLMVFLKKREDDRRIMATLRRGLISGQAQRTWPLLARFNGIGNEYEARVVQIIAGLYALNPKSSDRGNFGYSCRSLLTEDERAKIASGEEGPLSRRFHHLLAADGWEIFDRVIRFAMRIKQQQEKKSRINYKQLREDLLGWRTQSRRDKIRTEWAKAFWSVTDQTQEETQ